MNDVKLCYAQIGRLVDIKSPALNARVKTLLNKKELSKGGAGKRIYLTPQQIKTVIHDRINDLNGKIIYIGNLKGGVGKTALAYLLTEVLSTLGLKTCAIDLDVQSNLTRQFVEIGVDQPVFSDVIDKKLLIEDIIMTISPTLDLIPSSLKNGLIQKTLSIQTPKHYLTWFNVLCLTYLRSKYDVIIVDTPPSLTTLNSVFCLCLKGNDNLVIPACADEFSIMGINMFLEDVNSIRDSYKVKSNPKISIIMNKFFQNQTNNLDVLAKINKEYKDIFSKNIIRDSAKIRETINNKVRIGDVKQSKELFEILAELLKEFNILKKIVA